MSEPCRPILWWISCGWKPGWSVSTRKQARPRCACSGSVWAKISATFAWLASEMNIFAPLITPAAIGPRGARALVGGIGAGVGLGQPEAAEPLARAQLRQVVLLLLLGAPPEDRRADERGLHRDHGPHRRVAAADLLDHDPVGQVVESRAAVLARDDRARGSPDRRSCCTSSRSKCSLRSFSRARSTISLSVNARAVSRISRCSSFRSKSMVADGI